MFKVNNKDTGLLLKTYFSTMKSITSTQTHCVKCTIRGSAKDQSPRISEFRNKNLSNML